MLKRFLSTTIAGATLVAGAFAFAAVPASTAGASTCPSGVWPAAAEGRPTAAKPGMTGVALWHDKYGWHLRESEAGRDRAVFAGTISTDGKLVSVRRHLEGGDVTVRPGPHSEAYRFTNYGGLDGIDFGVACGSGFRLTAFLDGHPVPASHIVIGAHNVHPSSQPIVIKKVAA